MSTKNLLALGLVMVALASSSMGCDDPADPRTWAKKLDNLRTRKEALDNLARMPAEKARAAVPELRQLYESSHDPEHLRAIARLEDPSTKDLFLKELDFTSDEFENALIAAGWLGDVKAADAVDALGKAAEKKLPIKSRANQVRLAAIRALARVGDTKATPYLMRVLTGSADEQDFLLNKTAALALAELADPQSIPALLQGLFLVGRGAFTYQESRLALVRIGEASIAPLIEVLQRKNKAIEEMGKELEFTNNGIIPFKAAAVLGDLRDPRAVAPLKAALKVPQKGGEHTAIMIALGQIASAEAVDTLIEILKDAKQDPRTRASASNALYMSGDTRAVPVLMEIAKTGYVTIDGQKASDLRAIAAVDLSRIAGKEHFEAFKTLRDAETEAEGPFAMALDRLIVANECDKDIACYGKALGDPAWARAEKAAFALGFLGDKKAIPLLLKGLKPLASLQPERFPVHQAILFSLGRLADKSCKECIETLETQIEKDEKSTMRIPGARDMVGEERVTVALIKNRG